MKWILTLLPAIVLVFAMSGHANAAYDPNTTYAQEMVKAAAVGDYATGTAAEFMPVVPIADIERAGDTMVVPARLPRMTLAQLGLPVNPARAADAIDTELLVRRDGSVLAVRFIY